MTLTPINFVREFQRRAGLAMDGIPGRDTQAALDRVLPVPDRRRINQAGLNLIKRWEGLRLKAYPDPATGGDPWTIGYGSTGKHVTPGKVITEAEAEALLMDDLERFERGVEERVIAATDNQFAAMVSLAFNVGLSNFNGSTLLKKHNAGDYAGARAEFAKWRLAAGKVMQGLVNRRAAEAQLYGQGAL